MKYAFAFIKILIALFALCFGLLYWMGAYSNIIGHAVRALINW